MGTDGEWKMKGLIALLMAVSVSAQANDKLCTSLANYAAAISAARYSGASKEMIVQLVKEGDFQPQIDVGLRVADEVFAEDFPESKEAAKALDGKIWWREFSSCKKELSKKS